VRLLLDTHALLWWATEDSSLSTTARKEISQSLMIIVSAASSWEIATKFRLGRLSGAADLVTDFGDYLQQQNFIELPVSLDHGVRAGLLPGPHRDPFDRMLIAQAQAENLAVVSNDLIFDHYKIRRVW